MARIDPGQRIQGEDLLVNAVVKLARVTSQYEGRLHV